MFESKVVQILNLGYGNISNIFNFIKQLKYNVEIVDDENKLRDNNIILIPGVGSFGYGIKQIEDMGLRSYLQTRHIKGSPIIGICLGMQVLFSSSEESLGVEGLNIFKGKIKRIPRNRLNVGWSRLVPTNKEKEYRVDKNSAFYYFNHNYAYLEKEIVNTHSTLDFDLNVCAISRLNNTIGFQFHPEKSQNFGSIILKNVLNEFIDA